MSRTRNVTLFTLFAAILVIMLLGINTAAAFFPDTFEPDDTPQQAHAVIPDMEWERHTLINGELADWYSFQAEAGKVYGVELVDIFNSDIQACLWDKEAKTFIDIISMRNWACLEAGKYFIKVESRIMFPGMYDIRLRRYDPGVIQGRVMNHFGVPLPGVTVKAYQNGWIFEKSAVTDSNGVYRIKDMPVGIYKLLFVPRGQLYVAEWYDNKYSNPDGIWVAVNDGGVRSGINAKLRIGGSITGRVINEEGYPLPGIKIYTFGYFTDIVSGWRRSRSAADGTYRLGGLPRGSYNVWFDAAATGIYLDQRYLNKSPYAVADNVNVVMGKPTSGIDARLLRGGGITGSVTDGSGQPLAGIEVRATTTNNSVKTTTGDDGGYKISRLWDGVYEVTFLPPFDSAYQWEKFNDRKGNTLDEITGDTIAVTLGNRTSGIDAVLEMKSPEAVATVTGKVSNEITGLPIQGVNVIATRQGKSITKNNLSDTNGNYTLSLPAATYAIRAWPSPTQEYIPETYNNHQIGYDFAPPDYVTLTAGSTESGVDFQLEPHAVVTGRATDSFGNPLVGVDVYVYDADEDPAVSNPVVVVGTGNDGEYRVHAPAKAKAWKICFYRYDMPDKTRSILYWYPNVLRFEEATSIAVAPGVTVGDINAVFPEPALITGRVLSPDGIPVPFCPVEIYGSWEEPIDFTFSDMSGAYALWTHQGSYKIRFNPDGLGPTGLRSLMKIAGLDNPPWWSAAGSGMTYSSQWYNGKLYRETADTLSVLNGQTMEGIDAKLDCEGGCNHPPAINPMEDKVVALGNRIAFKIEAQDPDGDPISLKIDNMPPGADFLPDKRIFTWRPDNNQLGDWCFSIVADDGLTQTVEIHCIQVKKSIFSEDFSDGNLAGDKDWQEVEGDWRVVDGRFVSAPEGFNAAILESAKLSRFSTGRVETMVKLDSTDRAAASVRFSYRDGARGPKYRYIRIGNGKLIVGDNSGKKVVVEKKLLPNRWYKLAVNLYPDGLVEVYINEVRIARWQFDDILPGRVGLAASGGLVAFDDLAVLDNSFMYR